jgi:hypothetical protein
MPLELCSADDLACARMLEARKEGLLVEVQGLIAEACTHDVYIPDSLREAASLWAGGLDELVAIRGALMTCLTHTPV